MECLWCRTIATLPRYLLCRQWIIANMPEGDAIKWWQNHSNCNTIQKSHYPSQSILLLLMDPRTRSYGFDLVPRYSGFTTLMVKWRTVIEFPVIFHCNINMTSNELMHQKFYMYIAFSSMNWIHFNSSWPHAFAPIIARERRAAHGPKSRVCWSPGEPARVQPPFPQDIWTLSSSVIRLALIGVGVLARIWSIPNH